MAKGFSAVEIIPGFTCPLLGAGGECRKIGGGEKSEEIPVYDRTADHHHTKSGWTTLMCSVAFNMAEQLKCEDNKIKSATNS